jgi:hypothetical protein
MKKKWKIVSSQLAMVAETTAEYGNPKPHRREVLEQYVKILMNYLEKNTTSKTPKVLQLLQCGCQKIKAKRNGYFVGCQYVFDRFRQQTSEHIICR